MNRPYRMGARLDAVQQTREAILEAAYQSWLHRPYDEVNLEMVAAGAGVTRQTVHRQFGSKDDLFLAMVEWRQPMEDDQALAIRAGDIGAAVRCYIDRYERIGDALARFLAEEGRFEAVDTLLRRGRAGHRAELEHVAAPHLDGLDPDTREHLVLSLYAATDVMVWKLLRRDCDATREQTESVMLDLVTGVLDASTTAVRSTRPGGTRS